MSSQGLKVSGAVSHAAQKDPCGKRANVGMLQPVYIGELT
jgi:hypothetical protein